MKNNFVSALLAILPAALLAQPCANNSNVYNFVYNGHSYDVVKEVKNWTAASQCAVTRGGYLVHIDDSLEQVAVYNAITTGAGVSSTYASVADGGGAAYVWIGATDRNVEGTWIWDGNYDNVGTTFWTGQGTAGSNNGVAVGYENWGGTSAGGAAEPDNYIGIQDCGAMAMGTWPYGVAGEWNDISGANNLYYVIEYDSLLGIPEHQQLHFGLFPNPASVSITIGNNDPGNPIKSVSMMNVTGQIVMKLVLDHNGDLNIDISLLAEGLYFVQVEFENGTEENRKCLIMHK